MSVPAPTGGILSFASPKESIQRKGDPDAACFLCPATFGGVGRKGFLPLCQRAASLWAFPPKAAGRRRGIRDKTGCHLILVTKSQIN